MDQIDFEITALVRSSVHRFEGRPSDDFAPFDNDEYPTSVQVRASKGLVGDRYFGSRFTYATITFIASEKIRNLEGELQSGPFDPRHARRNVITHGLDVDSLARTEFTIETATGPIRFRSITPANPCGWMNKVFAEGAHQALRGHAGIRCEPLDDGTLSVGPARLTALRQLSDDELSRSVAQAPV